jgi:hypothetical protein
MKRIIALAAFLITLPAGSVQAQDVSERLKGATFAQQICTECHAVQAGQPRSPNGLRSYGDPAHVPPLHAEHYSRGRRFAERHRVHHDP